MTPNYLNPKWRYHGAASHANAGAFARRQHERARLVKAESEKAAATVTPIKKRSKQA